MKRLLLLFAMVFILSACGPRLSNVRVTVNLPPGAAVVDPDGKVVPIQINVGNKTVAITTDATVPLPALGL